MTSGIDHLLDTNVVIGLLKGHAPAVALARSAGLALDRAAVSQITRMELLGFPAIAPEEEPAAQACPSKYRVLGISDEIEALAITLRRSGGLKLPDAIIAATAKVIGAKLLTLDERLVRADS